MAASDLPVSTILDAIDEPSLVVRGNLVISANAAARRLLGRTIEGRDLRFAIRHPLALETITSGKSVDIELVGIETVDRPWQLSVRPLPGGALVRLYDRSAQRAAERMRTDFVANASHELRTPLATIIGYAETLAEPDSAVAGPSRFGEIILSEARRMLRIIEDLMSLSRIEADRFRQPSEQVDLRDIIRIAAEQAAPQAECRGCRVELSLPSELPLIVGDFGQLLQLVDNLLGNAIRYGCSAADSRVLLALSVEGPRVMLTVRDWGEGVPKDHLPRLTERFYRVDSARSRDSGGTGLGLAIVKHIAERHRAALNFRSAPGQGLEVQLAFPATAQPAAVTKP